MPPGWLQSNRLCPAFLYGVTLQRPDVVTMIPFGKRPKTLPAVLSRAEVQKIFDALPDTWLRTLIRVTYACGLRVSEVVHLRVADINSARMVVHVRQGKGQKDRLVALSAVLLAELRTYWQRIGRRAACFPAATAANAFMGGAACNFAEHVRPLGLGKHVTLHTLRHSYATHLLEAGVDVVTVQRLLGHRDLSTTARYLHVQAEHWERLAGPLGSLLAVPAAPAPPWPAAGASGGSPWT